MERHLDQVCREAAERLRRALPSVPEPQLAVLCADGLQEVAEHYPEYRSLVSTASPFMQEVAGYVTLLCADKCAEPLEDVLFMLVEALAMVMREAVLRQGRAFRAVQEDILRYFEQSGRWRPEEGTLVADFYYRRIPVGVMHSLAGMQGAGDTALA